MKNDRPYRRDHRLSWDQMVTASRGPNRAQTWPGSTCSPTAPPGQELPLVMLILNRAPNKRRSGSAAACRM